MTNQFSKLIKSLNREVVELKTVRRRSSLTLQTETKNITVTCQVYKKAGDNIFVTKAGLIRVTFPNNEPQLLAPTIVNANGRGVRFSGYNIDDAAGIIVVPTASSYWDSDLSPGQTKNVTITVGVVMTGDCTLSADQITWRNP